MAADDAGKNSLIVELTPGHPGGGQFTLRVTPEFEGELAGMLRENDLYGGKIIELTDPVTILSVISVAVGARGALAKLTDVMTAFIKRHDRTEVTLRSHGEELKLKGFSRRDAERLIDKTAALQRQWDQQSLQQRVDWDKHGQAGLEQAEEPEDSED